MADKQLEAQKLLRIKDVLLRVSVVSVRDDIDVLTLKTENTVPQFLQNPGDIEESLYESEEDESQLWVYRFSYRAGVRLILEDERERVDEEGYEPAVLITATFEGRYTSDVKIDEQSIQAFSDNNVGYNVWPFWREFVQSSCARIGLPNYITIPLYRLVKVSPEESESQE